MARANKVCSCTGRCGAHERGCPEIVPAGTSRCDRCNTAADRGRGTAAQRGYGQRHRASFRTAVLRKHPRCQCTDQTKTATHDHGPVCSNPSTVADHHPRSRRELEALGLNADSPAYGRGLCVGCHGHVTATTPGQKGGWNAR